MDEMDTFQPAKGDAWWIPQMVFILLAFGALVIASAVLRFYRRAVCKLKAALRPRKLFRPDVI